MLNVYKKVEKTANNPYGVISVSKLDELNEPIMICLSAQDSFEKSIFGMIKMGARAARINTTNGYGAGFKIDEFPVHFLGLSFKKDNQYKNNYEELVDNLLWPYLYGEGNRSVEEIRTLSKKINFMTYCDGTLTFKRTEKRLEEKFKSAGYSEEDIKKILHEISLVAIGTMIDTKDIEAKSVSFIDVNDIEIYNQRTEYYQNLLQQRAVNSIAGTLGKTDNIIYIFNGSGRHSLKEYFKESSIVCPAISSVVSFFLKESIDNENEYEVSSNSSKEVIRRLRKYGDSRRNPESLLSELDSTLDYNGAPKYSLDEAKLRHELDLSYANLLKIKRLEEEKQKKDELLKKIISGIEEYSSDTTFYQILISAGLWQQPAGDNVFEQKSDKEIRALLADDSMKGPKI